MEEEKEEGENGPPGRASTKMAKRHADPIAIARRRCRARTLGITRPAPSISPTGLIKIAQATHRVASAIADRSPVRIAPSVATRASREKKRYGISDMMWCENRIRKGFVRHSRAAPMALPPGSERRARR